MEHFASVYIVLDGPTQTTRPGNKKKYSSECAFQFTYLLFKNSQEFAFFSIRKEKLSCFVTEFDREMYVISINEVKLQKLFYNE